MGTEYSIIKKDGVESLNPNVEPCDLPELEKLRRKCSQLERENIDLRCIAETKHTANARTNDLYNHAMRDLAAARHEALTLRNIVEEYAPDGVAESIPRVK